MVPVATVSAMHACEATMEPARVEPAGVKSAAVEPAAMKPAKSTVETTAVETPTSAAVEAPSAPAVRRVGEAWLAEKSRTQQRSCNAYYTPPFARLGSAVA
jgi:hypothetical protein